MSDGIIREEARFFATTVGNTESHQKLNSSSWIEKFKQKNNLLGAKPKKGSIDTVNEAENVGNIDSSNASASNTPSGISPISPSGVASPPVMSPSQSQGGLKGESEGFFDFGYRHNHSQSHTSLVSAFSDNAPSLTGGATSPMSPYFSSESCGPSPFTPTAHAARLPPLSSNFARPRSQTFPMLGVEQSLSVAPASADQLTPKFMDRSMSSAVFESPLEDGPLSVDPGEIIMKRNNSVPDMKTSTMQPPPLPQKSDSVSPVSPPSSPTQEDARRALQLVMTYFQSQPMGTSPQDFMTIGKLMEKLKVEESASNSLPGGLHHLEEYGELRVNKKRSIRSL